jgi:uncharacterized protein Usg
MKSTGKRESRQGVAGIASTPPVKHRQREEASARSFLRSLGDHLGGDSVGNVMGELELKLRGYRLTTAEILYHMPDHPAVLQTFLWQDLDVAPKFPVLKKFLHFWETSLEGRLHSVRVAARGLISDAEIKMHNGEFTLH